MGGSAIKRIKSNKRSTLESDALNAFFLISMNGPKSGKPEELKMIKQISESICELKRQKNAPMVRKIETCTQTTVTCTQTQIYFESESQIEIEERLDAIIISGKYVVSNLMEMNDSGDSDSYVLSVFGIL